MHVTRPDDETVVELFRRNAAALGGPADPSLTTADLGIGESHLNLLVTTGATKYTLRISLRDDADKMAYEFAALRLAPEGLGPSPLLLDTSREVVPHPCAVLSYVEGETVDDWSPAHIRAHAGALARLHNIEREYAGPVDAASGGRLGVMHRFEESLRYWQSHHPDILQVPEVAVLVAPLRAYVEGQAALFETLERYSLIHGDAGMTNILFSGEGVRYIDWELAEFGDPALDLAMLAWDIDNPPWQLQFGEAELATFAQAYHSRRRDDTLLERHAVWVTLTKFFDHLHYRTRTSASSLKPGGLQRDDYARIVDRIADSLHSQLL